VNEAEPQVTPKVKISCQNVWKIFGPDPQNAYKLALEGMSKEEVLEKTGHVVAVKDVTFQVNEGEVFVIMGLSGSGKSTIVRCLNRLIEPTHGQIAVDDVDLSAMSEAELREARRHKFSMVFQHFALFPHRPVIDNVAYGLEVQGVNKEERREKAVQVLDMVGLRGWEYSFPHELSGGMQQRVGLARALAVDPEILLMDEAFSALDPLIRRQMQDEFLNLITEVHKTIVFITHDLGEALKMGERIAIMKDGEIVQTGSPEEIVVGPADEYVTEFVRDVPRSKVVPVRNVMKDPAVTMYSWQGPKVAMMEMKQARASYAFVMDPGRRLRGVITYDEARQAAKEGIIRLSKMVKGNALTIGPDQTLEEAIPLAAASENPIAVVDGDERLIGEVPRTELLQGITGEETNNGSKQQAAE
jgi:glycine betaine/proline transport system ATP-binding protein